MATIMEYQNEKIDKIIEDFKPRFGNDNDIRLSRIIGAYKKMKFYLDIGNNSKKKEELLQSILVHEDLIERLYKNSKM